MKANLGLLIGIKDLRQMLDGRVKPIQVEQEGNKYSGFDLSTNNKLCAYCKNRRL